ncbi:MAG: hypothetical protein U9O86_04640 [Campylobacterota bacterium]|nr:hypothetical protein [Campylobacterota bacterium]
MNVAQYTFQSPSASQVQVGRLDPSSVKTETTTQKAPTSTNETLQEAKSFEATQVKEVTPTVESERLLDVYA